MRTQKITRGFTLIELLVVVSVIALLIALLIPSLSAAKRRSRTVMCGANLRSMGLGTNVYLEENAGFYFPYHVAVAASDPGGTGTLWWFGFEASGKPNRTLDKTRSPLAPYTASLDRRMLCPDFPYDDPAYYSKFDQHAATYGYNALVAPLLLGSPTMNRSRCGNRATGVFLFADGVFFENKTQFEEGFYLRNNSHVSDPSMGLDGYAHFRHVQQAQIVFLDGHVDSQFLTGPNFRTVAGATSGNLSPNTDPNSIYGSDLAPGK